MARRPFDRQMAKIASAPAGPVRSPSSEFYRGCVEEPKVVACRCRAAVAVEQDAIGFHM